MEQIQHASLVCASCFTECDHEMTYAGRLLTSFRCSNCGATVNIRVSEDYIPDVGRRLASKPGRMMRRFRKHPVSYTLSLPRAVATKPREVVAELRLAIAARAHEHRDRPGGEPPVGSGEDTGTEA
ncbi:hypothetical protein ACH9EU_07530 [Kocuria sp. M1R5S2]|uniref:hypothetical protein n=1 Tax=Kocuria rhizosphaerae TaxID=3376285 RepID=UPI0037B2E1E1